MLQNLPSSAHKEGTQRQSTTSTFIKKQAMAKFDNGLSLN